MIRIFHVSDLHFHMDPANNGETIRLLDKVRCYWDANPGNNYLLVTGDITDDGHPRQYENAAVALRPFTPRLLVVPGNHDFAFAGNFYADECREAFEAWSRSLGIRDDYSTKTPTIYDLYDEQGTTIRSIGLISVAQPEDAVDVFEGEVFARGRIGQTQLDALDEALRETPAGSHKLVYLHHRPFECPGFGWFVALCDDGALRAILDAHSVDAVAFGHTGTPMLEHRRVRVYTRIPAAKCVRSRGEEGVIAEDSQASYVLDADSSVENQQFNEIVFDGDSVWARTI